MRTPTDYEAILAMEKFGGGFASRLAKAWLHADRENQIRLKTAFGDLLENSRKVASIYTEADNQSGGAA